VRNAHGAQHDIASRVPQFGDLRVVATLEFRESFCLTAHHILGPFGADSDLRRWGLKLAERGGKNGKKRAVIAVARKLAVLLHRLWVTGEGYEALRKSNREMLSAAA
jgi:hypothetical protein